jgi:hypothetical protein
MNGNQRGFALVTAILAIMILMALGYLVISVSTGDLKISSRIAGEKSALSAAETGVHRLTSGFIGTPLTLTAILNGGVTQLLGEEEARRRQTDPANPASLYTISNLAPTTVGPSTRDLLGFSGWEQKSYSGRVTGMNTAYGSNVQIDVGIGYAAPKGTGYE